MGAADWSPSRTGACVVSESGPRHVRRRLLAPGCGGPAETPAWVRRRQGPCSGSRRPFPSAPGAWDRRGSSRRSPVRPGRLWPPRQAIVGAVPPDVATLTERRWTSILGLYSPLQRVHLALDALRDIDRLAEQATGTNQDFPSRSAATPVDACREGDLLTAFWDLPGVEPAERSPAGVGEGAEMQIFEHPTGFSPSSCSGAKPRVPGPPRSTTWRATGPANSGCGWVQPRRITHRRPG